MSMPYDTYVQSMAKTTGCANSWGDHLTLDSAANFYNVRVWCIESSAQYECSLVAPEQEVHSTLDIYIGHLREWHYVSVTSLQVFV